MRPRPLVVLRRHTCETDMHVEREALRRFEACELALPTTLEGWRGAIARAQPPR